jgi:hypothetical protein
MTDDTDPKKSRGFEPPPWEREQFEELARRRAAAEADEAVVARAESQDAAQAPAGEDTPPSTVVSPAASAEAPGPREAVDERAVTAMLMELSAEEGPTLAPVRQAGKVFAGIVGGAGAAMVILAIATGVRAVTAETGADVAGTGAAFIAVFGLLALGAAAWLWVRADRSQGS